MSSTSSRSRSALALLRNDSPPLSLSLSLSRHARSPSAIFRSGLASSIFPSFLHLLLSFPCDCFSRRSPVGECRRMRRMVASGRLVRSRKFFSWRRDALQVRSNSFDSNHQEAKPLLPFCGGSTFQWMKRRETREMISRLRK